MRGPLFVVVWLFLAVVWLFLASDASAGSLTLAWDHSPDPRTAGYVIAYGTAPGQYTATLPVGYVTQATIRNLDQNTVYYAVVHAVTHDGIVGLPSSEVAGRPGDDRLAASCAAVVFTAPWRFPFPINLAPTIVGGVPPYSVQCEPPSGSLFRIGITPYECQATDQDGQVAACASTVTVIAPP